MICFPEIEPLPGAATSCEKDVTRKKDRRRAGGPVVPNLSMGRPDGHVVMQRIELIHP
jgi:hypothetical protein